jgi:dihydroorotase
MVARPALGPAPILGLPAGRLAAGAPAHMTLVDPRARWTLRAAELRSAGHHTPFDGAAFGGRAVLTIHAGRAVFGG